MELSQSLAISSLGMKAQGTRMKVIAQNIANADTAPSQPGEEPYRRKLVTFKNILDRETRMDQVEVDKIVEDGSDFKMKYNPTHPAADDDGYVRLPNINSLIEMMDMREAQRSYEANLSSIELARTMLVKTIDLIRGGN